MNHRPPPPPVPRRKGQRPTPPAAEGPDKAEAKGGERTSDRPTVNPPFDVEAFARASAAAPGLAHRMVPADTPTARPPPLDGALPEMRSEQPTLTDELELETARITSAQSEPPRPQSHNSPSMLSLANSRAASQPAFPAVTTTRRPTPPSSIEAAVLEAIGGAAPEITERTIDDPIAEMRERFALGDYTGALEMAEIMLAEAPDDAEAADCADRARKMLEGMFAARLGSLERVPSVIVQRTQLRWLSIDHRAGFVLSLVDGASTLDMILDVSGMPRLDALRILHELVQQRIVALK